MQIRVGPPVLVINHGSTFMVSELNSRIDRDALLGIFADDTRYLSYYATYANGEPWILLSSSATAYYASRIYLTNPEVPTEEGIIPRGTLSFVISRTVHDSIHEDLDVTNHGTHPVRFNLELTLRCDFADIFEVETGHFIRRGRIETVWHPHSNVLRTTYRNGTFQRSLAYQARNYDSPPRYANGRITYDVALNPGERWHACGFYILHDNHRTYFPVTACYETALSHDLDEEQRVWRETVTQLTTSNEEVYRFYRQSIEDLGALRLYEHDMAPDLWLPAAGVPKFVTIFGRDSLIVSLQTMLAHARFARGTLMKLAQYQASVLDPERDAQPGKIMHEIRFGELAHLRQIPHTPYYGTADATPLFLITLHETWQWLGDERLLRQYREHALRALEWIERYGDLDGDGFQEYLRQAPRGLDNQGWKDSSDAVVYPDGRRVPPPIALVELQGYVFDAYLRMAEAFAALGHTAEARDLRTRAAALQQRFEAHFWCDDLDYYAFALDRDKQPVKTVTSNPGHCLWSGIVRPERAQRVVQRLMSPTMWTGWGLRTLSAEHTAYNPFSYHRGSIWPHDNALIALGLWRYGFRAEAARIARGISEAASHFASYRIPELYAGIEQRPGSFPVQYLGANVPQAWAAGSIFMLLQAILGVRADAPNGRLYVDPALPDWLPDITLRGLAVGGARLDLICWREGDTSRWEATLQSGTIEVLHQPWQPWHLAQPTQADAAEASRP
ncbi:glycogen debranching N-terminal domain-containing protein [Kallotenue papyrolyticum]|uniref:amylo-alpha-1,6-glucosidase n=1 Tax=Kallotenue papyrolyticum TaxID=1325125 RepID=UPI000492D3F0|nr:amylo-alpha-1,6-glucosidase [Kallotenue papyrolyticum]